MAEVFLEPFLRWMRMRRVMQHIPAQSTVLDVGCGHKIAFLKSIADRIKQGYGVDFKVESQQIGNIEIRQMTFHDQDRLPFDDASIDVVTMLAVLEHIEAEEAVLREIYRVLKPQGRLVLTVPSVWAQPVLEFLSYKLKIVDESEIRDHKRYYNRRKLHRVLVARSGFADFQHKYFQLFMNNFCTVSKPLNTAAPNHESAAAERA
ncbi:class I SAM-dependent methyltransferase [filamentous cyanobacterium LEGE 11480]|uniref:Class I SAM-dependent methyltransferase n=1 Tax=Romeriopsis navalis LEGE 11480 TaxID=2777977 RepID=A0A928Z3E1_9CYAN|nr:class I SAM-dependent methyltransferase [Romeriopsis navalis]MBE9029210.1 class I SAM-dependent methyltransferase [Romeriopsis navalis LEGE 11480]